jgi:hypothetical protein
MGIAQGRTLRRNRHVHGIYCIEGDWWGKPQQSSVRPVMEMLRQWSPYDVPFIHRDVATRGEFDYYLNQWSQARFKKYPILYIALHGTKGAVMFGDGRSDANKVGLAEIGEALEGRCKGRIIHFGSCDTISIHGNILNGFLRRTSALCISGYGDELNWLEASALDILWLASFQGHARNKRGALAAMRRLDQSASSLMKRGQMTIKVASPT